MKRSIADLKLMEGRPLGKGERKFASLESEESPSPSRQDKTSLLDRYERQPPPRSRERPSSPTAVAELPESVSLPSQKAEPRPRDTEAKTPAPHLPQKGGSPTGGRRDMKLPDFDKGIKKASRNQADVDRMRLAKLRQMAKDVM